MSEYSTEKVLEWVNSSEAKAAKYEQEAKVGRIVLNKYNLVASIYDVPNFQDLRRKIDSLRDKIISCQEEIYKKYEAVDNIDQQIDNLEVNIFQKNVKNSNCF